MLPTEYGSKIIATIVDQFMSVRDQYAPRHTIRREALDGFMSATVIDRSTKVFIDYLELESRHVGGARIIVSNLIKLLYDLEARRFENGGHTDGHDLYDAAKNRLYSHYTSQMMKEMAQYHSLLSGLQIGEVREATKRIAQHLFDNHGEAHGVRPTR